MIIDSSGGEAVATVDLAPVSLDSLIDNQTLLTLVVPQDPPGDTVAYRLVKRSADIAIAATALAVFALPMVLVGSVVFALDRGPIVYRQRRIGRYGVPFYFYKFRSMNIDADRVKAELLASSDAKGAAFKMHNDPRVTRVGKYLRKFSLDELPQLFSVLSGDMTIIGPRPHLPEEVATYSMFQRKRLMVKPGLICLREIKGRSNLSFDEWVSLDLEYVRHRNLLLDLKIFLLSIPAVISGKGAY